MTNPDDKEIQKNSGRDEKKSRGVSSWWKLFFWFKSFRFSVKLETDFDYYWGGNNTDSFNIILYEKWQSKAQIKAPPGQQIIYPKDGPPS